MSSSPESNPLLRLTALLRERTGIIPARQQSTRLELTIAERMTARGLTNEEEYERLVLSGGFGPDGEFTKLVHGITIGETSFFRDAQQFAALSRVLTDLAALRRRGLRIWSAACSTGEEPYTIAIVAAKLGVDVEILGTDVNRSYLAAAEEALYGSWVLRHLPEEDRATYFTDEKGSARVRGELRRRVTFREQNLVSDLVPLPADGSPAWDVIFCRNVFIYFDRGVVERVTRRLVASLASDGWLFVAAAENLHGLDLPAAAVSIEGAFAYRPSGVASAERPPEPRPRRTGGIESPPVPPPAPARPENDSSPGIRALLDENRTNEAEAEILRALEANPLSAEIHYLRALLDRRRSDDEGFERSLRRCLFLDPDFWPAEFLLAELFERSGRGELAARALRHTLSILERSPAARRKLRSLSGEGEEGRSDYPDRVAASCRRSLDRISI